ncbi:1,2-phenylacetyl-CoA epoxidase subunit PaaC [Peribacillus sp. SCS-26]|uniref:1,2-phenylacetyl-CoA epoxidase subunit PaaC n=1 Tax=Paraperibacillus marinus TaxID=3115295 RepID=UPI003906446E
MRLTREDAIKDEDFLQAVTELLLQLADDDFIHAYRGSEWLGLAPHIEEDVAYSSISQDTMGHAAMFYQLLEELGRGDANDLAHSRPAAERRNAVLLELVNGPGTYLEEPQYDWAFAVVRSYFYTSVKKVKVEALKNSSYIPLAEAAVKVNIELYYHLLHWKTWFTQLVAAGGEAGVRMEAAMMRVYEDLGGIFSLGDTEPDMIRLKLIDSGKELQSRWLQGILPVYGTLGLVMPESFGTRSGNGRDGIHTADLAAALETLSEVYCLDKAATW